MRFKKHLEALSLVSNILAVKTDQHEMLMEIMAVLEQHLAYIRGTILLLSPDRKELTIETVRTGPVDIDPEVRYRWGEGIVGRVVSTGQSSIIPRISQEPQFRDRIHRRRESTINEISFICVPIKIVNEVVGTLSVDIPFSEDLLLAGEERVLSIVASMLANNAKQRRLARLEREALTVENLRLRDALGESFRPENMVGSSDSMRDVYLRIHQVSSVDTTVLIRGESGTGKELIASAIHFNSPRAGNKMIKVNCAALNENLLESEMFGHEKGAFTGAIQTRIGRLEEADGGTVFLDEIGDLPFSFQVKLLRFLQEREFERVGSNRTISVDVRILAATNRDLERAVAENVFRRDLYYRINVFPVYLPPLRERRADILFLANHFVQKQSKKMHKEVRRISTPAIDMMMAYHWPGNVRELENCIEHAVLVCSGGVIYGYDFPPTLQIPNRDEITAGGKLKDRTNALERNLIIDALKHTNGNIAEAAMGLGITSRMVRYKIDRFRIDYRQYFNR